MDKNLFSITGDSLGSVWVNDRLVFTPADDGMREVRIGNLVAQAGQDISDVLKLSGLQRVRVIVDLIDARFALEDAIDINHCQQCEVIVSDLWAAKKYCGTVKGVSDGIRIVVARQHTHGGETDWDLGNFSDQGNGRTTAVRLHINTVDRTEVRVRVLSAEKPVLENTGPEYVTPQRYVVDARAAGGWFYPIYNFIKDILATFRIRI